MPTPQELETVWNLFNLLEKLSNIIFDRYHEYLIERHLDEQTLRYFEEQTLDFRNNQSKQIDNLTKQTK